MPASNLTGSNNSKWYWRPWFLLVIGIILMAVSDMRGGAAALAWFSPIPFMLYAHIYLGRKRLWWLFVALQLGSLITISKIITPPMSYALTLIFSIPTGIAMFLVFSFWGYIRRKLGAIIGIYSFISLIVVLEWAQYYTSDMGAWGALSHSQIYNLPLLQSSALFGSLGISALMTFGASILTEWIVYKDTKKLSLHIILFVTIFSLFHIYGSIRLLSVQKGEHVKVAGVNSDLILTGKLPKANEPIIKKTTKEMLVRSLKAANLGAKIIIWNEGSTIIDKEKESKFLKTISKMAQKKLVHIVAAYIVPTKNEGKFENKYTWVKPNGVIAQQYFKHHPVPGEGSIKGTKPLRVIKTKYGNLAGAICYDYDFPKMALQHSRLGADIVFVPSSDWRGIDPQHTLMTRIRAIEGGFSLLRSVRSATSMAFDAYGRVRASLSYFERNEKIIFASLPTKKVATLFSLTGDWLHLPAIIYLLYITFLILKLRKNKKLDF